MRFLPGFFLLAASALAQPASQSSLFMSNIRVHRFDTNPLITGEHFSTAKDKHAGENINGPSVIRVPDWLPHRLGRYYMYFAHHQGLSIRLAYADDLRGPWTLYQPDAGVLALENGITLPGGVAGVAAHIASPDVHIEEEKKRLVMYFHGPLADGNGQQQGSTQKSFVATSRDGLDFKDGLAPAVLGDAYFRVFEWRDRLYAVSSRGKLFRAPESAPFAAAANPISDAWEPGPNPLEIQCARQYGEGRPRHVALRLDGDDLTVLFSYVGHDPERILATRIHLTGDWAEWTAEPIREVLAPELTYEGIEYPSTPSKVGFAAGVRQLRDPCLFQDADGKNYLFYSIAGETGIAGAEIEFQP